jgi:biopolymer transport protein ExbD
MRFARRKLDVTPPYVSMADIAFNLVLFFLILAKTQDDSNRLDWVPAKAAGGQAIKNPLISVTVDRDNRVYLNGQQIGLRDLADKVAALLGDKPPTERSVVLKIHHETLAATFEPIMEAVSQAGGEVVHVIEEERPS